MVETAIIIGDSQANGLIRPLSELLQSLKIRITGSTAHTGQQTIWFAREQIVKRLVDDHRPSLVLIIMGGNDAQRSLETWLPGVQEVVKQAKSRGAKVIWIGTAFSTRSDVQERHERVAHWQESVLPQLNVTWIDSMPMTQHGHSDGVHFTQAGYRAWANAIVEELALLPSSNFPWIPLLLTVVIGYLFVKIVR